MSPNGRYRSDVERFSRAWWVDTAKTFVWVALVTVLIWVYADMRFTDRRTLTATVRLVAIPTSRLALVNENNVIVNDVEQRVEFQVEGSREQLDRLEREYRDSNLVVWDVTRDVGAGEHLVDLRDVLNAQPRITERGLRVIAADPESVAIRLDQLVHEVVPVEMVVTGADLASPPVAEPVGVTVPKTLWEKIQAATTTPTLKTKVVDLSGRPTGQTEVTFEIFPELAGAPVRLDYNTIKTRVNIRRRTAVKKLVVTVRVLMLADWDMLRGYELVRKDPLEWRPEITVAGPQTDLDKLQAQDIDTYVVLTEDDRKPMETWTAREVTIRLPAGLQVALEGAPPRVHFRLDKRPAEPATP